MIGKLMGVMFIPILSILIISCSNSEAPQWFSNVLETLRNTFESPAQSAAEILSEQGWGGGSEADIEEIRSDLERYEAIINETVEAAEGLVNLNRLLAERYNSLGMFDLALGHYEEILRIEPANASVLNSAGIAAGQTALSRPTTEEKFNYLNRAQRYYERSISINPSFRDPYFGLAVLQIFELENVDAGKQTLLQALSLFPNDIRLLFVLARVAVLEERINDAIDIYERIVEISTNESEKNSANLNREALLNSY